MVRKKQKKRKEIVENKSNESDLEAKAEKDETPPEEQSKTWKELKVDKYLKRIIGVDQAHYGQIVRLVWEYIRKNKLQSPKSKKVIIPDSKLAAVVGPYKINHLQLMSRVKKHILFEN